MESINERLQRITEDKVKEACKKAGFKELYTSDIAKFLLSLSPTDRLYLIVSVNNAERDAMVEWADVIQARTQKLDFADGIASTLTESEAENG